MKKTGILSVNMLGSFSVQYDGRPVALGKRSQTRFLQLFQLLILHKEGVAKDCLIETLYGWEEVGNKNASINNLVYRLRKQLVEMGLPPEEYVKVKDGICVWDSSVLVQDDVWEFKELWKKALEEEETGKKTEILLNMWKIYQGELLPGMANETWVIQESIYLKKIYSQCVEMLGGLLKERREYLQMFEIYKTAARIYPFEEWESGQIDSLVLMGRQKEAWELYKTAINEYTGEMGIPPSQKLLDSFQSMRKSLMHEDAAFYAIKEGLKELERGKGAYYCDYPSFLDTYRILCRMTERNGQNVILLNCTLSQEDWSREKKNSQSIGEWLKEVISRSLRRGDFYTRYSRSTYLVILTGLKKEDGEAIEKRIQTLFFRNPGTSGYRLDFSLTGALEMDSEDSH